MKKKLTIAISLTILISLLGLGIYKYFEWQETKRYQEILNDFEEALIWKLDATGISTKRCEANVTKKGIHTSSVLISQGYLKKEKLLDIDGKSYCKAYAKTFDTEDCGVDYKIYLKCKNYQTKGYVDWE